MLDRAFWNKYGIEVTMRYRKHIFDPAGGGKTAADVFGKPYKNYSTKNAPYNYGTRKKTGNLSSLGTPQHQKFKNSNAPVLTGLLLEDFSEKPENISGGFKFGTTSHSGKVNHLNNMGRVISSNAKPLPNKVAKYLVDQANIYVQRKLDKIKGGTFNI